LKKFWYLVFLILLVTGCATETLEYPDDPESVVRAYFSALYEENYAQAVKYYGGTYEDLQGYHPQINAQDHEALFRAYIEITGGQLVTVASIIKVDEIRANEEYAIDLTFIDKSGKSFREGMVYTYTVKRIDGKLKVMELPPYLA